MNKFALEQWYEHCRRRKGKRWLSKSGTYVNAYLPLKTQLIQFRNWKYHLNSYRDDRAPIDFIAERLMNIGRSENYEPSISWSNNKIDGVLFNRQSMVIAIVENNRWKYLPKPIPYESYDFALDVRDILKKEIKENAALTKILEMPFSDFINLVSVIRDNYPQSLADSLASIKPPSQSLDRSSVMVSGSTQDAFAGLFKKIGEFFPQ